MEGKVDNLGATEEELIEAHRLALKFGMDAEPSGSASLVVLLKSFRRRHELSIKPTDRVLIVNTGNGAKFFNQA